MPKEVVLISGSKFCQNSIIMASGNMLGFQGHPEFTADYLAALIDRRDDSIGKDKAETARQTLNIRTDNDQVREWMYGFLEHALDIQSRVA